VAYWDQSFSGVASLSRELRDAKNALAYLALETKQPIVLVGHSRGGLLIRLLLSDLQEKKTNEDKALLARVKGAITLNTPHSGSKLA
jgi:triacylglycerol esterase/lipase EstA (alpha/beta hydrolase family)